MRIREHRGSLDESLKTLAIIAPTKSALTKYINDQLDQFQIGIDESKVTVKFYAEDDRPSAFHMNNIRHVEGYGVFGFTDGPIQDG